MRVTLFEYATLCSEAAPSSIKRRAAGIVPAARFAALRQFDLRRARESVTGHRDPRYATILDWDESGTWARARQWVGVMQVEGLQVEVLPKIDRGDDETNTSRSSLVAMLTYAGVVPLRDRALAALDAADLPLLEWLIERFARMLWAELRCGLPKAYTSRTGALGCVRGRIDLPQQLVRFPGRADRLVCEYDELADDTPLARILRATVELLRQTTRSLESHRLLTRCFALLEHVRRAPLTTQLVDRFSPTRHTTRFEPIIELCRLFAAGQSTASRAGDVSGFALFFDMNRVFEDYAVGLVKRHVMTEESARGWSFRPQGVGRKLPLLRRCDTNRARLALSPDLLFEHDSRSASFVIDTKWKLLGDGAHDAPAREDLYQMFAYAVAYGARTVTLLYPDIGAECFSYEILPRSDQDFGRIIIAYLPIPTSGDSFAACIEPSARVMASLVRDEMERALGVM